MAVSGGYRNTYIDISNLTNYSFAAADIGTAAANRYVIVIVSRNNSATVVSSVTVGGASCSQVVAAASAVDIWRSDAAVTSGTTATIAVNCSGANGHCGISVYAFYSIEPTVVGTATSSSDPATLNLNTIVDGVAIGGSTSDAGSTVTWSGLTEDTDQDTGETARISSASFLTTTSETPRSVSCDYAGAPGTVRACAVSFQGQPTGAATGTADVTATTLATKKSAGAVDATASVTAVGAPTFKATATAAGTNTTTAQQGYLAVSTATSAIAGASQATKKSPGLVSATASLDATSNATKKSTGAVVGSVAIDAVSNATKKAVGLVSASDTVAAVAATSGATKKSAAVVSENGSTVLALSSYKRGIRRPSALNDVATPTTVTLHDIPAPVALSIQ